MVMYFSDYMKTEEYREMIKSLAESFAEEGMYEKVKLDKIWCDIFEV